MFVLTFLLYGGLNQIMFLFLFYFGVLRGVNMSVGENPLLFSALSYSLFALLKMVSLEELLDNLRAMDSGIGLMIGGGWLDGYFSTRPFLKSGLTT